MSEDNPMRMIPEEYFKQTCVMRRDRRGRFIHPLTVLKRCERENADFVVATVFSQQTFKGIGKPIETGGEE